MNLARIISQTVPTLLLLLGCRAAQAQVNSGSNGSDGAFNPTTNIVINMADHPDGIYQYTSVNIPNGVTVTFIPNANNTPVVWLVQSNVVITGYVDVSGQNSFNASGALGGAGGWRGGNGAPLPTAGQGPGGGPVGSNFGGQGTYDYGNSFVLPLLGGSGGGGHPYNPAGGGGGGGAVLIAASLQIEIAGRIKANGGLEAIYGGMDSGGQGSGGGIRLVASKLTGLGQIWAHSGRVRLDVFESSFGGLIDSSFTQGFQPIIIPTSGQGAQLTVTSVGGVPVSASPTGALSTPDAVLSAQQNNPIPIVVHCSNLPLNTQITVSVKPANAPAVSATGLNITGTPASSTATVSLTMPRGGGLIYATAATGN